MSIRLIRTLVRVSTPLSFAAGSAAGALDGEETSSEAARDDGADEPMPAVETDTVATEASGMTCTCPAGEELQNGLRDPARASGWHGEGPVCWNPCASGFTITGWFRHRDAKIISADTSKCPWHDECGLGSSCSKCPAGYANDDCTCRRDAYVDAQKSYGRGAGTTPSCSTQ